MTTDPLSLAYRIVSQQAALPHPAATERPLDPDAARVRTRGEAELVRKAVHLRLDNVAEFYAGHDRQCWHTADDVPNWAPPFPLVFAEWMHPLRWALGDRRVEEPDIGFRCGVLCVALNVTDANRSDVAGWGRLLGQFAGCGPFNGSHVDWGQMLSGRWVLVCSHWHTFLARPLCGAPLWQGLVDFVAVSPAGRCVCYFTSGPSVARMGAGPGLEAHVSSLHVFGLGISFCHCKNVVRDGRADDRGDRWHRRTGVPRLRCYTLNIDPMRQVLRREGRSDEVGIPKALHICRGHFATYTEDRPLFGRLSGTFWRPDHVRGRAEEGIILKDYSVKGTPDPCGR